MRWCSFAAIQGCVCYAASSKYLVGCCHTQTVFALPNYSSSADFYLTVDGQHARRCFAVKGSGACLPCALAQAPGPCDLPDRRGRLRQGVRDGRLAGYKDSRNRAGWATIVLPEFRAPRDGSVARVVTSMRAALG